MNTENQVKRFIYLDDVRTPVKVHQDEEDWVVVRSYEEFVQTVSEIGLSNIELISLDHDLGPGATQHFLRHTTNTFEFDYSKVSEKTGLDCAKWLVEQAMLGGSLPVVVVHSANPVGSANIMGYINNYLYVQRKPQSCVRVNIEHKIDSDLARRQGWH
jgi:hypothetical protein